MFEGLDLRFSEAFALGLIALLAGRYIGRGSVTWPARRWRIPLIFLQVWIVAFLTRLAFGKLGQELNMSEATQIGFAETLFPLFIAAFFGRRRLALDMERTAGRAVGDGRQLGMLPSVKKYWPHAFVLAALAWTIFALFAGAFEGSPVILMFLMVFAPLFIASTCYVLTRPHSSPVRKYWQSALILASLVWAIGGYSPILYHHDADEGYPIIFGPLAIAIAVYFLFPRKDN